MSEQQQTTIEMVDGIIILKPNVVYTYKKKTKQMLSLFFTN